MIEVTFSKLFTWVLASMMSMQSPDTPGVTWSASYERVADVIATAAMENPLHGKSDLNPTVLTAALMIEWSYFEARFDPNAVGDSGSSFGLWQAKESTAHASREALLDPDQAAPIFLTLTHLSFRICSTHPVEERMAQYAYGRDCDHRLALSRSRISRARDLASTFK
jgi:hypothetical protein